MKLLRHMIKMMALISIMFAAGQTQVLADPLLTWNTFLGSSGSDYAYSIAVDGSGDIYVVGSSFATWGSPVNAYAGGTSDAYVVKIEGTTGALLWSTFIGGSADDAALGITLDSLGDVYITGYAYATFGAPVRPYSGSSCVLIAKLSGSTGALQWHTFLNGTTGQSTGYDIAVDGSGNIYVTGNSSATWGSPVNPFTGNYDIFAAKLDSSGNLQWNTFFGGTSTDNGRKIAIDGSGNVCLAGEATATWGSPVNPHTGSGYNAFAAKLNSTTGALLWNTFSPAAALGGLAVDEAGNMYLSGYSFATFGSPVRAFGGGSYEVYALKIEGSTGAMAWNTFLGGSGDDNGGGMAIDGGGNLAVVGYSSATWGSPLYGFGGGSCSFAARLAGSNGALLWSTFLGTSNQAKCVAVDTSRKVYVAGIGYASWGIPVNPYVGDTDAFVAKLTPADSVTTTTTAISTTTTAEPTTTTTSVPSDSSTTTSVDGKTTTTTSTGNGKLCPATQILGEDNPKLEHLRDFRDGILAQSAIGRKVIEIYYAHADSINEALERDPELRIVTRKLLGVLAPMVGNKEQ